MPGFWQADFDASIEKENVNLVFEKRRGRRDKHFLGLNIGKKLAF